MDKKNKIMLFESYLECMLCLMSWFTRNTKNWHIVYNWLPYSKPIINDMPIFRISSEPRQIADSGYNISSIT